MQVARVFHEVPNDSNHTHKCHLEGVKGNESMKGREVNVYSTLKVHSMPRLPRRLGTLHFIISNTQTLNMFHENKYTKYIDE